MNKQEQRQTAIRATRSEARHNGFQPEALTAQDALLILDDLLRKEPGLIACQWYGNATDAQINLFKREWEAWRKEQVNAR